MFLKQKILFIGPYPPPYAGPEMAMKTLLESPLAQEFDISFLKTNVRTSNAQKGKIDFSLVGAFFSFIFRLLFMMLSEKPRFVYYFVTATRLGWLGRDIWCILISKIMGAKVVIHMRAGHFRHNFRTFRKIEKKIIRFACSHVSLGIVQAEKLKDQFEGLIAGHKIVSIYNAIDCGKYQNPDLYDYQSDVILFLGHLSFAKGYCDLLKAIPKIAEKHPGVRFCFAGTKIKQERNVHYEQTTGSAIATEDPDECYERFVSGTCEKNHICLGNIGEGEKIKWLKRANFLVLPSYSEGFSMSVLEAVTMGKPVICTRVGALGEIVKDEIHGLLIRPGNIQELEQAIDRLLSDSDLRNRIAENNHAYALQTFSKEIISRQLSDCFNQLLKEN